MTVSLIDTPVKSRDYLELLPGEPFLWADHTGDAMKLKTTSGFVIIEGEHTGQSIPNSCVHKGSTVIRYRQCGKLEVVRDDS